MTRPFGYRGRVTPVSVRRALSVLSASALVIAGLVGCTPAPEPEPEPTKTELFASDEEAFAAAEETYTDYTEAVNAADLSSPESIEPVYALLVNPARAASKENYTTYHAEGITRVGDTRFDSFTPVSYEDGVITIRVCVDVSDVELVNEQGDSVVPADRVDRQPLEIEMVGGNSPTGLVIRSNVIADGLEC